MEDVKIKSDLGQRLELVKFKLKLNNSRLAEAGGITGQAIADIINGVVENPRVSLFIGLSRKYQLNYEWLLEGRGEMLRSDIDPSDPKQNTAQYDQKLRVRDLYIAELIDELAGKSEGVFDSELAEVTNLWGEGASMLFLPLGPSRDTLNNFNRVMRFPAKSE